jgi:hypothetical protein
MVKKDKQERKLEKEIITALIFMAVIVGVYLLASSYFKSLNYIDYHGLTFSKQRATTNLTVYHHQYYLKTASGKLIQYNLYLRNDPNELEAKIPVIGDEVVLNPKQPVYFTINSSYLNSCTFSTLSVATMSSYLADNQFKVVRGDMNFWTADGPSGEWVTCERKPASKVIELYRSNKTEVVLNGNCYELRVATCEDVLPTVERFISESVLDARKINVKE